MSNNEVPTSLNEHLSALLDDEAGSFEERRVLDELKSDPVLSQKLANFALIGETMRTGESQQSSLLLGSSFLDNIHQQIDKEDQFDQVALNQVNDTQNNQIIEDSKAASSILRPIGGFALAASLGALAFMGLQNLGVVNNPAAQPTNIVDKSGPTAIAQATLKAESIELVQTVAANEQYIEADAKARSMLKRYVDSHMQYASSSTFVPSVRVIAFTDNQ